MTSTIEKVARAWIRAAWIANHGQIDEKVEASIDREWPHYEPEARAVIAAVLEDMAKHIIRGGVTVSRTDGGPLMVDIEACLTQYAKANLDE